MDEKELRAGNYVLCNGKIAEVKVIDSRSHVGLVWIGRDEWCGRIDKLQPITITDEILDACGFLTRYQYPKHLNRSIQCKVKNAVTLVKGGFISSSLKKNAYYFQGLGGVASFNPIATVHQLQNLYFSLAGKELDIDGTKLQTI